MLTPREIVLALVVGTLGVLVPGAWAVELVEQQVEYASGDIDVPALLLVPKAPGPHAAVVFIHGRSGLNDRVQTQARRRGGGGVAVLGPGYHAALLAVRRPEVAGMVGYYPHLASPNAPEPVQVYRYMPEVEDWKVPALLMVGDQDHQLRREQVVRVAERLKERGVAVELVVYPGAQRAFDFRRNMRTVGDDLAREDALNRTVRFLNRVLGARGRETE